ncbi:hypothetical protein [Streptomyces sp. CC219B]|uniref:hypothetical protein n=1 Tax=Streptomyces sp. CC219B TaxID=3044574 RepID=UPI0024A7F359|nr:hypothetical protein [Streptomyces sp. CC219B]
MRDPEILAHIDGRGRAEFVLGGFEGRHTARITAIGHELGYVLKSTEIRGRSVARLVYVRDDSPLARRRAGQTLDRLRTGGALLPPGGVEMATRRQP